jgi:hypothetical protein
MQIMICPVTCTRSRALWSRMSTANLHYLVEAEGNTLKPLTQSELFFLISFMTVYGARWMQYLVQKLMSPRVQIEIVIMLVLRLRSFSLIKVPPADPPPPPPPTYP